MAKKALLDTTICHGLASVIAPLPDKPNMKHKTLTKAELELACLAKMG